MGGTECIIYKFSMQCYRSSTTIPPLHEARGCDWQPCPEGEIRNVSSYYVNILHVTSSVLFPSKISPIRNPANQGIQLPSDYAVDYLIVYVYRTNAG